MVDELVKLERRDDGVAVIRLANPPLNALSGALLKEVAEVAERLQGDRGLKSLVVTGDGDRAFAAGADIAEFAGPEEAREAASNFHGACGAIEGIGRPVIAAIRGFCLGGGLELALACDFRVAGESARLGQPEVLLGIIPGGGATQRLPRIVGVPRAKEMIWSGRQVDSAEALHVGLVDRVETDETVLDATLSWASELASGAVVAMGLAKRAMHAGIGRSLEEGLQAETEAFAEVFETEDAAVGIESFREHGPGKARFSGR